mmetsp:Transcript_19186/g.65042  ORF Transcript_19186/g.65042 Transcript_19186/m.65042 type:complete len:201 (+) Transcript_19186:186-788(+)
MRGRPLPGRAGRTCLRSAAALPIDDVGGTSSPFTAESISSLPRISKVHWNVQPRSFAAAMTVPFAVERIIFWRMGRVSTTEKMKKFTCSPLGLGSRSARKRPSVGFTCGRSSSPGLIVFVPHDCTVSCSSIAISTKLTAPSRKLARCSWSSGDSAKATFAIPADLMAPSRSASFSSRRRTSASVSGAAVRSRENCATRAS